MSKTIGDMTPEERDAVVKDAVGKFQRELDLTAPQLGEVLSEGLPEPWQDDERFPMADWRHEVGNGDTLLGYPAWVVQQREMAADWSDGEWSDDAGTRS